MKKFFKENDKYLFAAKTVFTVFLVIFTLLSAIFAVLLFVAHNILGGIIVIIGCIAIVLVADVIFKLALSHIIDVKLIRNKLYEESNDDLKAFYSEDKPESKSDKD